MEPKITVLAAFMALAACATTSGTFCEIAKPIRLSDQAVAAMSDQEVGDALAHNLKGARLCGWKP
jgi:hypothetical protein